MRQAYSAAIGIAAPIRSTDRNQARSSGEIKDTAAIIASLTPLAVPFPLIPLAAAYEAAGRGAYPLDNR